MEKHQRRHQSKCDDPGFCICPKCEHQIDHQNGVPCQEEECPQCGTKMLRVGSQHYKLWEAKKAKKS